jgi:hypothetical protein
MKKSRAVTLVLVTATFASCTTKKSTDWESGNKTYVRADTSAPYTRNGYHGVGARYWAFRPFYNYNNSIFGRSGYHSNAISSISNFGGNSSKAASFRGGFGRAGRVGG